MLKLLAAGKTADKKKPPAFAEGSVSCNIHKRLLSFRSIAVFGNGLGMFAVHHCGAENNNNSEINQNKAKNLPASIPANSPDRVMAGNKSAFYF